MPVRLALVERSHDCLDPLDRRRRYAPFATLSYLPAAFWIDRALFM